MAGSEKEGLGGKEHGGAFKKKTNTAVYVLYYFIYYARLLRLCRDKQQPFNRASCRKT
jgi:hypothetical protein